VRWQPASTDDQVIEGQPPAVEVAGLCKNYGRLRAVEGVSFRVRHGEIYALPGPDGAGETTTAEILEGHRKRASLGAWTGRLAPPVRAPVWLAVA
jgi:ABC-2 type transport system ATP-binding protein